MTEQNRLLKILKDLSYEEGEFTLTSGKKSSFYIDCKETTLNPEGMYLVGTLMYQLVQTIPGVEAVGGVSVGGDPLVCSTVLISRAIGEPLPGFFIRKEPKGHGTNLWLEGGKNLQKGMKVVILEDVVTTGGSSLKAIETTEREGFTVIGVVALLDRLDGGKEAIESKGYVFKSIFNLGDLRPVA
ncbi:MAG TPA: orotate phosphoribosyltransferase [Deltaproteobacteria bacterium]|nr:orotate phosphoribosyltransferase [Deltaproteobacteria bacterium]